MSSSLPWLLRTFSISFVRVSVLFASFTMRVTPRQANTLLAMFPHWPRLGFMTPNAQHTNANALRSRWVSGSVSVRVCLIIQFESYSLCDHVLEATAQLEPSLVQFRAPSQQRSTLGVRVVNQSVSRQSAASLAKNLLTKLNF